MSDPFHFRTQLLSAKAAFEKAFQVDDVQTRISLLDSMLFECSRARRIARDAPEIVAALGIEREEFLAIMDAVAQHRNVIEHWADVKEPRRPTVSVHNIGGLKMAVDETSYIILGREAVLKGQLNLFDLYRYISAVLADTKAP